MPCITYSDDYCNPNEEYQRVSAFLNELKLPVYTSDTTDDLTRKLCTWCREHQCSILTKSDALNKWWETHHAKDLEREAKERAGK